MNMTKFNYYYKKKKNDALIANFLKISKNKKILSDFINNPSEQNRNVLDDAFKNYYRKVKIITYISKFIRFFSIDYDKKISKYKKRNNLILDDTQKTNNIAKKREYISTEPDEVNIQYLENEHIIQSITNEKLSYLLKELSPKQLDIIDLKYRLCYSNKEIAKIMDLSEQTVSYNLRATIKTLKKALTEGGYYNG